MKVVMSLTVLGHWVKAEGMRRYWRVPASSSSEFASATPPATSLRLRYQCTGIFEWWAVHTTVPCMRLKFHPLHTEDTREPARPRQPTNLRFVRWPCAETSAGGDHKGEISHGSGPAFEDRTRWRLRSLPFVMRISRVHLRGGACRKWCVASYSDMNIIAWRCVCCQNHVGHGIWLCLWCAFPLKLQNAGKIIEGLITGKWPRGIECCTRSVAAR